MTCVFFGAREGHFTSLLNKPFTRCQSIYICLTNNNHLCQMFCNSMSIYLAVYVYGGRVPSKVT